MQVGTVGTYLSIGPKYYEMNLLYNEHNIGSLFTSSVYN